MSIKCKESFGDKMLKCSEQCIACLKPQMPKREKGTTTPFLYIKVQKSPHLHNQHEFNNMLLCSSFMINVHSKRNLGSAENKVKPQKSWNLETYTDFSVCVNQ